MQYKGTFSLLLRPASLFLLKMWPAYETQFETPDLNIVLNPAIPKWGAVKRCHQLFNLLSFIRVYHLEYYKLSFYAEKGCRQFFVTKGTVNQKKLKITALTCLAFLISCQMIFQELPKKIDKMNSGPQKHCCI